MNITYRISEYPNLSRFYWVIIIDGKPVERGDEATRQDCLDVMTDMIPSLANGDRFRPCLEDTRWQKIIVTEIHSRDFD
jgi:hypothetical protein